MEWIKGDNPKKTGKYWVTVHGDRDFKRYTRSFYFFKYKNGKTQWTDEVGGNYDEEIIAYSEYNSPKPYIDDWINRRVCE